MAGLPATASSETVEAPERATTRCVAARRAGISTKKVARSALTSRSRYASRAASISVCRHCWSMRTRARSAAGSMATAAGTTWLKMAAPCEPPVTRMRILPSSVRVEYGTPRMARTAARTGFPVMMILCRLLLPSICVAGKDVATQSTRLMRMRLARPSTEFCS